MTILNVEEVAKRLNCTPETVRDHTPHDLPGVKFGRDWVYVEADVIAAVSRLAHMIQRKAEPGEMARMLTSTLPAKPRKRGKGLPELGT